MEKINITETNEFSIYSQNGEDGIINYIFKHIGLKHKIHVEIGVNLKNKKYECNTLNLLNRSRVFWIDMNNILDIPKNCTFVNKKVTSDNIKQIFSQNKIPKNFDLLSIDIDGNDYHIRESLNEYKPRVCIMEYNGTFDPNTDYIMPENNNYKWLGEKDKTFGASLKSLTEQADRLGYDLVYCESSGFNAFFVRKDINCFEVKKPEEVWKRVVWDREIRTKFISFYTEDYIEESELLKSSLKKYGIDSSNVEHRERKGSWEVNTQMKAEFILEKLKVSDCVVWMDADSYLLQKPSFFEGIITDVGFFFLPAELSKDFILPKHSILKDVDKYLQSGTMYFKNNERVIKLLETWIEINKKDSRQWDQWTLQMALENSDVSITQLPAEYIAADFIDEIFSITSPVIKHTNSSSRVRNVIRTKIKTYEDLKGRTFDGPDIPKWIFRFGNDPLENLHHEVVKMYHIQLENNPEYELFYFDTTDKLRFIKDLNNPIIDETYNRLIPPAFKSDFLKYVLLYSYGGVYMDFTMETLIPLKDIFKGYKQILVKDSPTPDGLCVGFITSKKGGELVKEAMMKCINNVSNNLYGENALDVTGPFMFSRIYKKLNGINTIPLGEVSNELYFYNMADSLNIYDGGVNDVPIIQLRMENHHKMLYNYEHFDTSPFNLHYSNLYRERKIYENEETHSNTFLRRINHKNFNI
jgi:mannosyltransferase OCH1-like enzyme